MNSNDRPTKRFLSRYFHDNAWWATEVAAYDREDAEVRCRLLNMKLDGEHVMTIPWDNAPDIETIQRSLPAVMS